MTPEIETWLRRLGHCNFGAIIDMTMGGVIRNSRLTIVPQCVGLDVP